jgi:biotin carboxylase
MNVIIVGPVSRHATLRFVTAARESGLGAVLLGVPNDAFHECRGELTGCVELVSLDVPIAQLAESVSAYAPVAVVAAGELAVPIADRLAAHLGLRHNPLERLHLYRSKDAMRAAFAAAGLPQPAIHATFSNLQEAADFHWAAIPFPVIVKPVDGAASYFVSRCENVDDVLRILPSILGHRRSGATGLAFRGQALVEELVPGPEYSMECLVEAGRLRAVFSVEKFVSPFPSCDEVGHLCAQVLDARVLDRLGRQVDKVISAFGVEHTVLHVEFKLPSDGVPRIIEVGNRVAGDRISELVELRHGWGLEEALVRLRSGLPLAPARRSGTGELAGYGIKFLFRSNAKAGVPEPISVLEEEIADRYLPVTDHSDYHVSQRLGYVIVGAQDLDALRAYLAV